MNDIVFLVWNKKLIKSVNDNSLLQLNFISFEAAKIEDQFSFDGSFSRTTSIQHLMQLIPLIILKKLYLSYATKHSKHISKIIFYILNQHFIK